MEESESIVDYPNEQDVLKADLQVRIAAQKLKLCQEENAIENLDIEINDLNQRLQEQMHIAIKKKLFTIQKSINEIDGEYADVSNKKYIYINDKQNEMPTIDTKHQLCDENMLHLEKEVSQLEKTLLNLVDIFFSQKNSLEEIKINQDKFSVHLLEAQRLSKIWKTRFEIVSSTKEMKVDPKEEKIFTFNELVCQNKEALENDIKELEFELKESKKSLTLLASHITEERNTTSQHEDPIITLGRFQNMLESVQDEFQKYKNEVKSQINKLTSLLVSSQSEVDRLKGCTEKRTELITKSKSILTALNSWFGIAWIYKRNKIRITEVKQGGPAKKAGLLRGDIIECINGEDTRTQNCFKNSIRQVKPGDIVSLQIQRSNVILHIPICVTSRCLPSSESVCCLRRIATGIVLPSDEALLSAILRDIAAYLQTSKIPKREAVSMAELASLIKNPLNACGISPVTSKRSSRTSSCHGLSSNLSHITPNSRTQNNRRTNQQNFSKSVQSLTPLKIPFSPSYSPIHFALMETPNKNNKHNTVSP